MTETEDIIIAAKCAPREDILYPLQKDYILLICPYKKDEFDNI